MRTLRLQTIYWLAGFAMAAGCLMLGGLLFHSNLSEYRRYAGGEPLVARLHNVLVVINRISAERESIHGTLADTTPAGSALTGTLATTRALSDQALAALHNALQTDDRSASAPMARLLDKIRLHLNNGRQAIDRLNQAAGNKRQPDAVLLAADEMVQASDLAAILRDRIGRSIIDELPELGTEVLLGSLSSNLRDQAGRVRTYISMRPAIAPNKRAQINLQLAAAEGRMEELRQIILAYSDAYQDQPRILAALALLHQTDFAPAPSDNTSPQAAPPGNLTVTAPAPLSHYYLSDLAPLDTLRQLIIQAAEQRLDTARDSAARMLALSGGVTPLVCIVLVLIGLVLHRLLFRPLLTATEQITAIAQGDLSTPDPGQPVGPELRETFEGLHVLRENQRRRQAMERDQQRRTYQLQRLSETDALSGMLNRRALEATVQQLMVQAENEGKLIGLILFDIDHFKTINDTYGHDTGDQIIRLIGRTLQPMLRARDTLARFGGEEFVALLPDTSEHELLMVAERLRTTLAMLPVHAKHPSLRITASFGTAVRRPGTLSWNALFMLADKRLYQAKHMGRNRVCAHDTEPASLPPVANTGATRAAESV